MRRGDLITIATQGDFGKHRPAVIVQADHFNEHSSVTVLPVTSTLVDIPLLRITVQPSDENSLHHPAQVMVDKIITIRKEKAGPAFGRLSPDTMLEVERCLAVFLGIVR